MPLTERQYGAMRELFRRGELKGPRASAARELIRRHMAGNGSNIGKGDHDVATALNSFADTATLGGANYAEAGLAAIGAKLGLFGEGAQKQDFGKLYSTALDLAGKRDENLSADNPYSSLAGSLGGALAGGAAAGRVAAKAGFTPAKTFAGRAGQYALGGAGAGATEQALTERAVNGNTLTAGVVGGLTGGVGGGVAEKALLPAAGALAGPVGRAVDKVTPSAVRKAFSPPRPKTAGPWRKLAAKLRTPVEDMESFIADTKAATGQMPSIAQVVHARDQGLLQGWSKRHNTFGTKFNEAAQETAGLDLNTGKLRKARSDTFESSVNPIRDTPVKIDEELLGSPHVSDAMAGPKMKDIRIKVGEGEPLTVGDVDRIRLKLRGLQKAEPGGPFGDFADQLREDTASQVPEYGQALERYSKNSKHLEGFEAGKAGKARSEVSDTIETPEAVAGHDAGARTRQGQQALRNVAPSVPADDSFPDSSALGRGTAHLGSGGQALGTFHTVRAFMDNLPESYQRELAEGLLTRDPARIHATLGKLRKAGADLKSIRELSAGLSGVLGANTAGTIGPNQ